MAAPDDPSPTETLRRLERLEKEQENIKAALGRQVAKAKGLSRRDIMVRGGYAALGAALLGGAFQAGTETAKADAVAADVGTQADPWRKVYTHALDAGDGASELSIDSPIAAINNNDDILEIGPSGGLIHRRSPSSSSTPVQDAIDAVNSAGGGQVWLPSGEIDDTGPIQPKDFVEVRGRGFGGSNATVVNVTDGGKGIEIPSTAEARFGALVGFEIQNGSALGTETGPGLHLDGVMRQFTVDLRFDGWTRPFVMDSASYENWFRRLYFTDCDAGANNGLFDIQTTGPVNRVGLIAAYPTDSDSASDSKIAYFDNAGANTEMVIGAMNIGGTASWAIDRRSLRYLEVGPINWEPSSPNATPDRVVYQGQAGGYGKFHFLRVNGTADNAYFLNEGGPYFGNVQVDGTLNGDVMLVNSDITDPVVYEGPSSDVNDGSGGTLSSPVNCLGDLSQVT